ncbi:MAG: hypothetical protein DLM63_12230 [Solirubrobacterales bacterium]|nr:MAG: hypothetical protein DLM63_12230 [Solirubrobacterales bacterium]
MPGDERNDADPSTDEHRCDLIGGSFESNPQGAGQPHALAGPQLGQSRGAGADDLEQEFELVGLRPVPHVGERPGKERSAVASTGPAVVGTEHVELAGPRDGSSAIAEPHDAVGPHLAGRIDRRQAAPERSLRPSRVARAHAGAAASADRPGARASSPLPAAAAR